MGSIKERVGGCLADYLSKPREANLQLATSSPDSLSAALKKGDVLLVEGTSRVSSVIKYLTQSTWSHAALYVGDCAETCNGETRCLVEADLNDGVRSVPLSMYSDQHTRICRPVGLSASEIDEVVCYAMDRLGDTYDRKNIVDLARYLLPLPPLPGRWRRSFLQLGSGDPTQAICSSLIAQAFQSVHYPILPAAYAVSRDSGQMRRLFSRHPSLYTPRDFDVSPYFKVIKPMLEKHSDYRDVICWGDSAPVFEIYSDDVV
ncbi:YiiX/YebB-like N1pC/P60 family cysteine hydrolase [Neptunomonas marina]|uniref:Lipo-like protein n=1 Tax=Neptunomonas marina TaxID=1815562 RepID=A0A437QDH8_9GAMM|nr:YiiX/YebB-like N1pC/P60 family cysteine hydrolase [Neptunomonas marina]RVU32584.1 lipo-like protein [Neptunomonas marina]